jgi:membrane protease YdiL (CAAX protease family)
MSINLHTSPQPSALPAGKVNWKQVGAFIALTFGLTWLLDLALYFNGGLASPAALIVLQCQMLLPAFSAMLLGMFFWQDSPIHITTNKSASRWFTWYFLVFTFLYIAAVIVSFIRHDLTQTLSSVMLAPGVLGMILVIVLRAVGGKGTFANAGMGGGKAVLWLLYGLVILLFAGLQTALNWLFKLGSVPDISLYLTQAAMMGMSQPVFMIVLAVQTVILGPFLGLLVTFGEEYGWRGYLQPALMGLGKVRGVAILGVIWGMWHWPVIWMGYNYPNHPYLGSLLMVLFCVGMAFILGYAVLKAKGVWIAAFLHALINQSFSFFMGFIFAPKDPTYAFGIGLPGLAVFALVVGLILLDPVWRQKEQPQVG